MQGRHFRHQWLGLMTSVVFLSACTLSLLIWRWQSFPLLSVQSASMVPIMRPGDAVVVKRVSPHTLVPGDIVSYHDPAHPAVIITHRLLAIRQATGLLSTKGDNTPAKDAPVPQSSIIGKVTYVLPRLGYILDFLRQPIGLMLAVYVPALHILWQELKRLCDSYRCPTYRFPDKRALRE